MLKTVRKRKHALLFLATFIATFSILFGGFVVGGPVLADDNQPEPPVDPGKGTEGGQEEEEQEEQEQEEEEQEEEELEEPDEDSDGVSDAAEDELSREVTIVQEPNRVKIESERKASPKDEFKVELEEQESLRIKYEYKSETDSVESDVELVVQFTQLIEYTDIGEDGFDEGDIRDEHPLEGFTFILPEQELSDDGESLQEITAATENGVFLVRVYVPEEFAVINGQQVAPTTLKIDIEIHWGEASQLGLKMKVETNAASFVDFLTDVDGNLEGISAMIGEYSAVFDWVHTVEIDGDEAVTTALIFEDDEPRSEEYRELKLYLLYPLGQHIIHDPKIGTPLSALSYAQGIRVSLPQLGIIAEKLKEVIPHISIANLFFGALVATLLVVSVPVLLRRKKG